MIFKVLPVLDYMLDLYQMPAAKNRFQQYLQLLHGNTKADLSLPISGFNPMAKKHVLEKL